MANAPTGSPPDAERDSDCEKRWHDALSTDWFGRPLFVYREVNSTMDVAAARAKDGAREGEVIAARMQTQGRGRLGRIWESSPGGLYFSVLLDPPNEKLAHEVPQIALVAGLAAVEALHQLTGKRFWIRWPNDVLSEQGKVAGILAEHRENRVVLGVGINVLQNADELPEGAASVKMTCDAGASPAAVLNAFGERFEIWYALWLKEGFSTLRRTMQFWLHGLGEPATISTGAQMYEGQNLGVDEQGRFLLRLDSGIQKAFDQGETTRMRPTEPPK